MRITHNAGTRLAAAILTTLCVAAASFALVSTPALAANPAPTLSVHVTEGTTGGSESNNNDGAQLPQEPEPAGAGFIYELILLDADKVADTPGTQAERTQTVLSNLSAYTLLVDGKPVSVLGVSDSNGNITTADAALENPEPGVWVSGGTIANGTITGGTAYLFSGTDIDPQYWYLKLVYHPAGLEIQRSEPGLVALPYVSISGDSEYPQTNYDVNVYPKTQACIDPSLPDGEVTSIAAFEQAGHADSRTQVRPAVFNASGTTDSASSVTPTKYESCQAAQQPTPAPNPEPGFIAKTGAFIEWLLIVMFALAVLALVTRALRRHTRGDDNHYVQLDGGQSAVSVEKDQR